jgi:hypothetical protein
MKRKLRDTSPDCYANPEYVDYSGYCQCEDNSEICNYKHVKVDCDATNYDCFRESERRRMTLERKRNLRPKKKGR